MEEALRGQPERSPLVGRARERALLATALDDASSGLGTFVLIEGAAGIGKSRLAREAAAIAVERAFTIFVGSSSKDQRGTAYAPLIDGMRDRRWRKDDRKRPAARALHDALVGSFPDGDEVAASIRTLQIDRRRVIDAMLQYLGEVPAGAGCLVVIEDVHWADQGTMRLLAEISRHAGGLRCTFVLTYRDDELAGNDAMVDLLHALTANHVTLHTMRLRPLTWSETRTMAQTVLGIALMPPTAFIDQLYARAEGNPFFTEEILRSLPGDEHIERADLRIPDRLPVSVTRLLENRIKRLPEKAVRALASAAVLGRRFDEATLAKVGHISERVLRKSLHDAVDVHLIRDAGDGRTFEFQHALVREAAERILLSSERKELHQRIAEELATRRNPAAEPAAIAYHYGQAGLSEQLGHHAVAAADDAWRTGAPMEAARWYEQALAAAATGREPEPEPLLRRAAEAFAAARNPRLASATFESLVERQRARGDVLAEAETLAEFANMFHGDLQRRQELLERALRILEPLGETAALARVYARLASLYVAAARPREAIAAGRMARDMARRTGATDAEAVAQRSLGTIVAAGGDVADGCRRLRRSIQLAKTAHKHMDVYLSSLSLVNAAIRAGDWDLAETTARESIDYAREVGAGSDAGSLMSRLAEVLRLTGRFDEACRTIDAALLLLDQDETYIFNTALLAKGLILADLGRWQEAQDLVEPILPTLERSGQFHVHGTGLFVLAVASRSMGRRRDTIELLERLLAAWRETEDNYYVLPVLLFACRLYCEEGDQSAAQGIISDLRGVEAQPQLAKATVSSAEAWLAVAEDRLDDAIRLWGQSVSAFDGLGRPVEASRARLELGRTLLARGGDGDRNEAKEHLLAIRSLFADVALPEAEQAEGLLRRHRLVVTRAAGEDGPLTAREREIVALVAQGMTNRAIATELTLSTRTVDNHVSRILNKLQLASRAQIAAYAMEHGLARGGHVK